MKITKLSVGSHFGANKTPGSGFVEFDDGKDYAFSWVPVDETYFLSGFVRTAGRSVRRIVHSPKRVALLKARLDA